MSLTHADVRRLGVEVGELLAEHSSGKPLEEFQRWADDPEGFMLANGAEPTDYQADIARSVVENKYTAVQGCHGCGKEWEAGWLAPWAAYCRGMLVLIVSASERQVIGQTMKEVRSVWRKIGAPGQLFTRSVRINGEDRIVALTGGASIDALTGWHDPNGVLVIISEGQGERLEDSAYEAAFAVAVDDRSRVLVMGNPTRPSGRFFEVCNRDHWSTFKVSAFDTPNVKAGEMVRPGFPSPDWPEEVEREYGAGSPYYQGRVLGEFPSEGEESLLNRDWLEAAASPERHAELYPKTLGVEPLLSVDPARYGADATVCAVKRGPVVERLVEWRGADTMQTVARIEKEAERLGMRPSRPGSSYLPEACGSIIADVVGLGAGVVDRLRQLGWRVSGYNGGEFTHDKRRWFNRRAESYWRLRELLELGNIAIPDDRELFAELLALRWFPTGSGQVQLERKQDMKKRLGRSPDRADAVCMAFAGTRTARIGTYRMG